MTLFGNTVIHLRYIITLELYTEVIILWLPCFFTGSDSKESAFHAGDPGLIPGLERSLGEGNGNTLQYSCLENFMDKGAWWARVHGIVKSGTWLRDYFHLSLSLVGVHLVLNSICLVSLWKGNLETYTEKDHNAGMKAEIRVMLLPTRESQRVPSNH